jgi:hypothetical protein
LNYVPRGYAEAVSQSRTSRTAILVLGMSRSGTSLCSRILNILGGYLPNDLMGPAPSNPHGHWEPRQLVVLNEQILREFGRSWDDPRAMPLGWVGSRLGRRAVGQIIERIAEDYAGAPLLVIKDPRICRLAPLYFAALTRLHIQPAVVLCARHPAEIIQSLASRNGMAAGLSELLWLRNINEAEAASRDYRRTWTSFDALLGDSQQEADRIGRALGLTWPNRPEWTWAAMEQAVQPALRNWITNGDASGGSHIRLARRTWKAIRYGLVGDEIAARALFDEVAEMLAEFDRFCEPYDRRHAQALEAIHASTSWRLTAPFRFVKTFAAAHFAHG